MPEGTVNAIALLVNYLLENNIPEAGELPYFRFLARLHAATDGSSLGLRSEDGRFTALTAVGGKITTENGIISQTIDVRYGTSEIIGRLCVIGSKLNEEAIAGLFGL